MNESKYHWINFSLKWFQTVGTLLWALLQNVVCTKVGEDPQSYMYSHTLWRYFSCPASSGKCTRIKRANKHISRVDLGGSIHVFDVDGGKAICPWRELYRGRRGVQCCSDRLESSECRSESNQIDHAVYLLTENIVIGWVDCISTESVGRAPTRSRRFRLSGEGSPPPTS